MTYKHGEKAHWTRVYILGYRKGKIKKKCMSRYSVEAATKYLKVYGSTVRCMCFPVSYIVSTKVEGKERTK